MSCKWLFDCDIIADRGAAKARGNAGLSRIRHRAHASACSRPSRSTGCSTTALRRAAAAWATSCWCRWARAGFWAWSGTTVRVTSTPQAARRSCRARRAAHARGMRDVSSRVADYTLTRPLGGAASRDAGAGPGRSTLARRVYVRGGGLPERMTDARRRVIDVLDATWRCAARAHGAGAACGRGHRCPERSCRRRCACPSRARRVMRPSPRSISGACGQGAQPRSGARCGAAPRGRARRHLRHDAPEGCHRIGQDGSLPRSRGRVPGGRPASAGAAARNRADPASSSTGSRRALVAGRRSGIRASPAPSAGAPGKASPPAMRGW